MPRLLSQAFLLFSLFDHLKARPSRKKFCHFFLLFFEKRSSVEALPLTQETITGNIPFDFFFQVFFIFYIEVMHLTENSQQFFSYKKKSNIQNQHCYQRMPIE